MSQSNAYQAARAYRDMSVTVPPLKAVVMLFDGAILSLQRSIEAREAKRYEDSFNFMIRTTKILRGLSHQLDPKKGGELAHSLFGTYNSLITACLRASAQPNAVVLYRRLIAGLTELRDAWAAVAVEKSKSEMQKRISAA